MHCLSHGMASGSPGHRTESGAVGSSYQKMVASPEEEPACLMLPPNQSALLRSHRKMVQKLLSFCVSSMMAQGHLSSQPMHLHNHTGECHGGREQRWGAANLAVTSSAWVKCFQLIVSQLFPKPSGSPLRDSWRLICGQMLAMG